MEMDRIAFRFRWSGPFKVRDAALPFLDSRESGNNDFAKPRPPEMERYRGTAQHTRINGQWRICLVWDAGDAWDVAIVDYH